MFKAILNFFKPMWRTIWIGLAGQGIFLVCVFTMAPLRMWKEPIVNYNLYYVPILALMLGALFYRCCTEEDDTKGAVYGYFAALFAWPLIGEVATIPVEKGLILQFSDLNIKLLGGYFYVVAGWLMLKIMWRTGAMKKSVCVFFLVFLCIWTFELYMDNYSSKVPVPLMAPIAYTIGAVFSVVSLFLFWLARRTDSMLRKTVYGCLFYITLSLVMMGFTQWNKPSTFYIKYEAAHIGDEIESLKAEQQKLEDLKQYMTLKGYIKPGELDGHDAHEEEAHEAEEKH